MHQLSNLNSNLELPDTKYGASYILKGYLTYLPLILNVYSSNHLIKNS